MTPPRARAASSSEAIARVDLYRLLADGSRLRMLGLCATEELAVSELAELLGQGQPMVSRHAAALRDGGLLEARRQGTWLLLRLARNAAEDGVVADAVAAGRAGCEADGSLRRLAGVIAARDRHTREFFARADRGPRLGPPDELAAYLHALGRLLFARGIAVDVGTGDGSLLEVLAPTFAQVVALDRSEAQLGLARARVERLGVSNVRFVQGELEGPEIERAVRECGTGHPGSGGGADAVFAARLLHHAPAPARAFHALVRLARPGSADEPGGAVLVLDYEPHGDEALRHERADLWLGFEPSELCALAEQAGLCQIERVRLPGPWCGAGPDHHLHWQLLVGRRAALDNAKRARPATQRGPRATRSSLKQPK